MVNYIPVIGWVFSFVFNAILAVPFWFLWTACGVGRVYFYWLPPAYIDLPFFHCVGIFMTVSILKTALVPKIASQEVTTKKGE